MKSGITLIQASDSANAPKQRTKSGRPWILPGVLGVAVLFLIECGLRPLSLQDRYFPPKITPLPQLEAVAVYLFNDKRGKEENAVGESSYHRRTGSWFEIRYASEPVATSVTQAFADGLKARGFPVVDMTKTKFGHKESKTNPAVAVSGEILEFWYTGEVRGG